MGKEKDLKKYMGKSLTMESLNRVYRNVNIDSELSVLYRDIILTLNNLIFRTFPGDDVMEKEDYRNHFNFCWNKTLDTFKAEDIEIKSNDLLFLYFYDFYTDIFYSLDDKSSHKVIDANMNKLWSYMFNTHTRKSQSDLDVFLELYELFDASVL